MRDDELKETFGEPLLDVLAKHGFHEVGRFQDSDGWYLRDYSNGEMGVRLMNHMGTDVEFISRSDISHYRPELVPKGIMACYSVATVAADFGDVLDDRASNDNRARYIDRNFSRIARIFAERDRGVALRALHDRLVQESRRRFGIPP